MFVKFLSPGFSVDSFFSEIKKHLEGYEFDSFSLGVRYPGEMREEEKEKLRTGFQKNLISKIVADLKKEINYNGPDIGIIIDFPNKQIKYIIKPIFVYGRYNKYSREIAQTYHFCYKCKGSGCSFCNYIGKLSERSVEEILSPYFLGFFCGTKIKFHSSGREDKDVRMLGLGRPFVIQVVEPKKRKIKKEDLKKLENKINKSEKEVRVKLIKLVDRKQMGEITSKKHKKLYSALVSCELPLTQEELDRIEGEYKIEQRTPTRVSKRRTDLIRKKTAKIKKIKLKKNGTEFRVWIESEAGLYIKEFISGDYGRTNPSLSGLLKKPCVCKELDVLRVF